MLEAERAEILCRTFGTVPCVPERRGVDTGGLSLFELTSAQQLGTSD